MTNNIRTTQKVSFQNQKARRIWQKAGIAGALLAVSSLGAVAQDSRPIGVNVNGQPVDFGTFGPQQVQGRVLVPVRGVLEKLGADITWVPKTHSVVASSGQVDIELHIGDRRATVNGKTVMLDVPAQNVMGHTLVPLRFLGEALGADVKWNGETRTVLIHTQGQVANNGDEHNNGAPPHHERDHADNGAAPVINAFRHNGKNWLHGGDAITATLEGTPGGQASFRIPGLTEGVPMRETSPGHYTGAWQVPQNKPLQLANAAVIGSLQIGNKTAPLLQAADSISVDAMPPRIRDRSPDPDSRVTSARPNIYAVLEDRGSGIDVRSIRLLLNGKDVTRDANVTRDFVSYTPPAAIAAGPQTVQLIQSDLAGNRVESTWKFVEAARESGGIKSVTANVDKRLEPGDTLHVEMLGTPGGKAAFSLGSIKNIPLRENAPGRYVEDYTVRKGDDVNQAHLAVHLNTPQGEQYEHQVDRAVSINTGKPMTPVITYPGPNDVPSSPLVIKGKATPNTQVHVKVDYKNKVFGVFALQGTAADTVVDVDKNGNWQTDPINLSSLLSKGNMQYTIQATSVNASNENSETKSLNFRGK